MSTTIGFGYSIEDNTDIFDKIERVAKKYKYGLLDGIQYAEADSRFGINIAKKHEKWDKIVLLQSPIVNEVGLAFGINKELIDFETTGKYPKFFDFLKEVIPLCSEKCKKLGVFFSGEWYEDDRIRFSYGSVDDLISLLSMPGNWGIRYLVPETGRLQDSDEIPLIFDLKIK